MTKPPNRYRPTDAFSAAEAVFQPSTPPVPEPVRPQKKDSVPVSKETVTIKLDSDLLVHFQEDGPGWQERTTAAPRRASALSSHPYFGLSASGQPGPSSWKCTSKSLSSLIDTVSFETGTLSFFCGRTGS